MEPLVDIVLEDDRWDAFGLEPLADRALRGAGELWSSRHHARYPRCRDVLGRAEGCGEHIEDALKDVPTSERCTCPREEEKK